VLYHRIDVKENCEIRSKETGKVVSTWQEQKTHKAYSYKEAAGKFSSLPGEPYWMSYRYQLEGFINRVRGRETQHWVTGEDSIAQMEMVDMAYEKSGLGPRLSRSLK